MRNLAFLLREKFKPLWKPFSVKEIIIVLFSRVGRGGNYSAIFGEWKLASFQDEIRESDFQ